MAAGATGARRPLLRAWRWNTLHPEDRGWATNDRTTCEGSRGLKYRAAPASQGIGQLIHYFGLAPARPFKDGERVVGPLHHVQRGPGPETAADRGDAVQLREGVTRTLEEEHGEL